LNIESNIESVETTKRILVKEMNIILYGYSYWYIYRKKKKETQGKLFHRSVCQKNQSIFRLILWVLLPLRILVFRITIPGTDHLENPTHATLYGSFTASYRSFEESDLTDEMPKQTDLSREFNGSETRVDDTGFK